jgi:cytochrome c553
MPDPVAHGRAPAPRACGVCHLPNGAGHPESANLAGLPADYLARQTEAFANGERASPRTKVMGEAARAISPAEIKAAAAYFAALPPSNTSRVSEATEVPRSIVNSGGLRLRAPDGGTEPLGARIISLPLTQATVDRDPRSGFVSYVPPGSLARGKALAAGCVTCHGADLRGGELGPPIAGQHPLYVYRQLNDLKIGNRRGGTTAMMGPVVAPLDNEGMIALASYLGSLSPIGPTGKH